jgi:Fur family ferric uptake transcriptional regulator
MVSSMRTARGTQAINEARLRRALERLRQVIHDKSLKMTRVREAIARAALAYEGHFSVDDLLKVLRTARVKDAHQATVYRAMPLLLEAGLVQPALVADGDRQLYEAAFEREHHDHLVCTHCGRVIEYRSEALEALQRDIAARYDFELSGHVHVMRGRCRDCRRTAA